MTGPDAAGFAARTPAGGADPADAEWAQFAAALAREIARLSRHGVLIVREPGFPRHLAQFLQEPDRLRAEVAGDRDSDGNSGLLSVRDRRLLAAVGWHEPDPADRPDYNWTQHLAWPATSAEYRRLADATVTALRDVQELSSPRQLVSRSWEGDGRRRHVDLPGVAAQPG